MNPYTLRNNDDLLDYLVRTARVLVDSGHGALAQRVERAALFANGSPSEFLHEAQSALRSLGIAKPSGLDLSELRSVVDQIEVAFRSIGGA